MKQLVSSDAMPRAQGSYSQALLSGGFLFTAGTDPFDPRTNTLVGTTIEEQTAQVLDNLEAALAAAGLTFDHVVKVTTHLQHLHRDFEGYDRVYRTRFAEPWPVRTTVGADLLLDMLIEVDLIAVVPE